MMIWQLRKFKSRKGNEIIPYCQLAQEQHIYEYSVSNKNRKCHLLSDLTRWCNFSGQCTWCDHYYLNHVVPNVWENSWAVINSFLAKIEKHSSFSNCIVIVLLIGKLNPQLDKRYFLGQNIVLSLHSSKWVVSARTFFLLEFLGIETYISTLMCLS